MSPLEKGKTTIFIIGELIVKIFLLKPEITLTF